jgi:hypothetical protein
VAGTKPKGEWPGSVYIHHELGRLAEVARGAWGEWPCSEPMNENHAAANKQQRKPEKNESPESSAR